MPELPEVETVRRSLHALIVGKTIQDVSVLLPRIIRTPDDIQQFIQLLKGRTVQKVDRRGKYLLIHFDEGQTLVSHLRMEGKYGLYQSSEPVELHTHVRFFFTDGMELRYRDVRQFGTMDFVSTGDYRAIPGLHGIGVEPLDDALTVRQFRNALIRKHTTIKAALLDQSCIAGLGNIYVDESLFLSGIHPERQVSTLKAKQFADLYTSVRTILANAVAAGGSSVKSYVNGYGTSGQFQHQLLVYGKQGTACPHCGHVIEKLRVAGRGTHICPNCQPKPRNYGSNVRKKSRQKQTPMEG
ncbi:DNA-formamidopyrimidine glycosylase [Fodinisporobacter ferrooxydans]|uniref:Formamidopyrimidine-DNA glycosylase n=1 Tax=Fodinisporobacter ferrooxydans TaxID=2901836 RepID=A0ABY4CQA0_9BACL|nr:DNA-formamidopyrimidine glycosylase [Alicyclobacillaceae bacterium MYW30-H2]